MSIVGRIGRSLVRLDAGKLPDTAELDENIRRRIRRTQNEELATLVRDAWTVGQSIDVSKSVYGPSHFADPNEFVAVAFPYYSFLAGLVRNEKCSSIFEIGSHYGGSTFAMLAGVLNPNGAHLMTVDVTDLNDTLHKTTGIRKLTGDANSSAILKEVVVAFDARPIDLLYVDAAHNFLPTIINVGLYSTLLKPRFIVIDDICLNNGMRQLWDVLSLTFGDQAINCVDIVPTIRDAVVGFGLIRT